VDSEPYNAEPAKPTAKTNPDERATHLKAEKYIRDLSIVLTRHIIPILGRHRGIPTVLGAGTLIATDRNQYLITAAHVIDPIKAGKEVFIYVDKGLIQNLSGEIMASLPPEGKTRADDHIDNAVIKLRGHALPPFPNLDKYPLPKQSILCNALPRHRKQYLLVGFPSSKSKAHRVRREIVSKPYSFRNVSAPDAKYEQLGISADSHILLAFDRERAVGSMGEPTTFPSPIGMSGSPLWLLYDDLNPNDPLFTPIVGIVIEHRSRDKVILATDIQVAVKIIRAFES
jgi:hypothetical protein